MNLRRGFSCLVALCAAAISPACKRAARAPEQAGRGPAATRAHLVESYPTTIDRSAYAGSAACAGCHASEHAAWLASPHGRSVLEASPATVLGDFQSKPLAVEGGEIAFLREGDRYFMEIRNARGAARHAVDLVIGSGRQHQDYLTRDVDPATGATTLHLLPAIWTTPRGPWISSSLYQPGSIDPRSPSGWQRRSLVELGCFNCHVSQGGYRLGGSEPEVVWNETRVNCEACHGPAAEHVAKKSAGQAGGALRDLTNLGPVEEARLCGVCHGDRSGHRAGTDAAGWPWFAAATLRHTGLRVDGTQTQTIYQYSGHELSECYRGGGLRCVSCHAPHSAKPRALDGESAEGKDSDRQCTACHRNYLDEKLARAHAHHERALRCIDCHMSESWIRDTPERRQRTSDHTISIPRPEESLEFHTPDACTTCHEQRDAAWALEKLRGWGSTRALGVRPWVRAVALGRARAPEAAEALAAVLADPKSGPYLDASALDLLEGLSPAPQLAPALERWTHDADPWVRALGFRALIRHDPEHARAVWARGLADPHAIVRLGVMPLGPLDGLTPAILEQDLRDELDWSQRPQVRELLNLSRAFSSLGETTRALDVLGMAEQAGTLNEVEEAHVESLRATLRAGGSGGAPGAPR